MIAGFFFYFKYREDKRQTISKQETEQAKQVENSEEKSEQEEIFLDMNGDGEPEKVIVSPAEKPEDGYGYIAAYNSKGEEIGRTPEWIGSPPGAIDIVAQKLETSNPKEFLRIDMIAGPHQFETIFWELWDGKIIPVAKTKQPSNIEDYLFYITQDSLIVLDIDGDGFSEVCEIASVYLSSEELNDEEKKAIDEVFEEGAEDAKEIAGNEQGQRVAVIWDL